MALLDKCRIIVRNGVGYDGLDLEGFGARGIPVCNVPDYGTTEVADHAIAMMLALRRGIVSYNDGLRQDPVGFWHYRHQRCVDRLRGATFGVVGLGRIGTAAARRAQAFDQQVMFYDPYLPDGADLATGFIRARSLAELFQKADAVSVHTPLTEETEGFINSEALSHAKPSAILINTSRGPVVDVDAVYEALKAGTLGAAALDVLPVEPPEDHPLVKAYTGREEWLEGRLILSPHAAFFSLPGQADLRRKGIETIVAYFAEEGLRNCVNSQHLRLNV
jgi:D-3-phosphoglycerate dehydrogenase/C-terminal binding protein